MKSKFLSTGEVAKILDCSAEWVRICANSGDLPAIKTSRGMRLFREKDVERLLEKRNASKRDLTGGAR